MLERDLSTWHKCPRKLAGTVLYIRYGKVQLPVTEMQNNNGLNKWAVYLLLK